MHYFSEYEQQIYSTKTREYFREVLSSYTNNNLRSATVMLYSVVICDILYKLEELEDMYGDKVAEKILNEINKSRNSSDTKQKSQWEKELIEQVKKNTEFLDDDVYCNIKHLYDHRNLCAHPALNKDYDLFRPNTETVAAHIRNMIEGVFIKPPVYITTIVETLVADLQSKSEIFSNDYEQMKQYTNNKYFSRMSEKMFTSTFKALWKFVYVLDNEDCNKNKIINNKCLRVMLDLKPMWLFNIIDKDEYYNHISTNNKEYSMLILELCCHIDGLYNYFTDDFKKILKSMWTQYECDTFIILWFIFNTFDEYKDYIYNQETRNYAKIKYNTLEISKKYFLNCGRKDEYIKFCLFVFGKSRNYDSADSNFTKYISPIISDMSQEHFDLYVKCVCENNQIKDRRRAIEANSQVIEILIPILKLEKDVLQSNEGFSFYDYLFCDDGDEEQDDDNMLF